MAVRQTRPTRFDYLAWSVAIPPRVRITSKSSIIWLCVPGERPRQMAGSDMRYSALHSLLWR
jgi:hypothetical protein